MTMKQNIVNSISIVFGFFAIVIYTFKADRPLEVVKGAAVGLIIGVLLGFLENAVRRLFRKRDVKNEPNN